MPHQDLSSENTPYWFGLQLREAIQWLVQPKAFAEVRFRQDCSWTAWTLAAAAILWAWTDDPTWTGRFGSVRQIIQNAFGLQQELAGSYQAFLKMLVRWTATLLSRLLVALRCRMKRRFARHRVAGWTIFGVDGRPTTRRCGSPPCGTAERGCLGTGEADGPTAASGRICWR